QGFRVLLVGVDLDEGVDGAGRPAVHAALFQLLAGVEHGKAVVALHADGQYRRAGDGEDRERAVGANVAPVADGDAGAVPLVVLQVRVVGQREVEDVGPQGPAGAPVGQPAGDLEAALHLEVGGDRPQTRRGGDVAAGEVEVGHARSSGGDQIVRLPLGQAG